MQDRILLQVGRPHMKRQQFLTIGCVAAMGLGAMLLSSAHANVSVTGSSVASVTILPAGSIDSQQGLVEGAVPIESASSLVSQISKNSAHLLATPRALAQTVARPAGSRLEGAAVERGTRNANFTITGDQDQSVSVSVPSELALTRIGGSETVTFTTISDLPNDEAGQRTASDDGVLAFNVGGRLAEGGDRVAGRYAGVLRVTAQYN